MNLTSADGQAVSKREDSQEDDRQTEGASEHSLCTVDSTDVPAD